MSPEVRQAAAERMRAYWVKKKGEKATEEAALVSADVSTPAAAVKTKRPRKRSKARRSNRTKKSA
ncbi:MAG: hypothetical protein EHM89_18390 [Acidobacteria bacterium]|nr:MAG: hypothetical protein EHM89_18390 [Acidobacteriota bacterium]